MRIFVTDEDNEIISFDGLPLRFELAIKIFWEAPKGAGRGAESPSGQAQQSGPSSSSQGQPGTLRDPRLKLKMICDCREKLKNEITHYRRVLGKLNKLDPFVTQHTL